jgi:hypothetical protein
MVQAGGVAQALLLPVLGGGALWLRYRGLPKSVLPGRALDVLLWVAAVLMIGTVAASAFLASH